MSTKLDEFRKAVEDLTLEDKLIILAAIRYIKGDETALDSIPDEFRHLLTR